MFLIIKFLRKLAKILNAQNALWQIFLGALIGGLLGFLPIWPRLHEPSPVALALFVIALIINCHLGSLLVLWGLGTLLALALAGPALAIGQSLDGVARTFAEMPLMHASWLSHTGHLGSTVLGLVLAPLMALALTVTAKLFRDKVRAQLEARKKLVTGAKVGTNTILWRVLCWFFDI